MSRYWAARSIPLSLIAVGCALPQSGERPPAASARPVALPITATSPEAATQPPSVLDSGLVLVPTASGVLFVLEPEPEDMVPVRVSWAPLLTPVYDPSSRQAVVSAGDGVITAVDLGTWLDRRDGA